LPKTQPEYFQPMETSTPEPQHLSNNEINEVGTLDNDKQNEDESGLDDDEEDDEESNNNSVMSNTERSNVNQTVNLSINDRNQTQNPDDRQIE